MTSRTQPAPDVPRKVLSAAGGVNRSLEAMEYAVRGQLVLRAEALARQLSRRVPDSQPSPSESPLPFHSVVYCNIGNPQSVGQKPISFVRQVLAAIMCPTLIAPDAPAVFPSDVVQRARDVLAASHGVGAYSESRGLPFVRARVAKAIHRRDGFPSHPDNIFLSNGASDSVKVLLSMLLRTPTDGVMIPIPQYPLYSASMTALNGAQVGYYLDEDNAWGLGVDELQLRLDEARGRGITVRALVVINPGNPTGQVLSEQNLKDIIHFCERENLVIMADEVYQKNVYTEEKPFVSFKKVVSELRSQVELASFHSVSKGVMGECGLRGGYMEVLNMDQYVNELIYKLFSVSLCSNIVGQVAVDLMMTPPEQGDPSYELYNSEVTNIYESLRRKAIAMSDGLNAFEGVRCNPSEGAMYLFPRITIPPAAVTEAKNLGLASADVMYCLEMLEATGICVVPGSGFGQRKGTYHFRTTFLPSEKEIPGVIDRMHRFHQQFMLKYS
uniref:Alanine transaminase n=1 Tax=Dumontia simplex TaxID=142491 RepID=A0A097ITY7_9FLOR|nr:alanine transaminase [Dumontia simplex]